MMWARNLLFIGLVLVGIITLTGSLFPPHLHPPAQQVSDSEQAEQPDYQTTVERVNEVFRKQWAAEGLTPAEPAPELAIIRRLSLALTGSIPSLQEIREFEADLSKQRLRHYVDRLLHDRRFADYFAERLARTYVGTEEGPFIVYRRRRFVSWLGDNLSQNRPYDALVRELISGQGLWTDNPATNFITATFEPEKKGPNPERLAARTARAFLGVRLDCAQCHDHPFQKWKQKDFQGLAAFYGQAHQGFTGIYDGDGEYIYDKHKTGQGEKITPSVPFHQDLLPGDDARRSRLARWITDPQNPYFARATVNRMWALMLGRPLVEPVDDLGSVDAASGVRPDGAQLEVLNVLARDFTEHGHDLQRLLRIIAASAVFQIDSAHQADLNDEDLRRHEKAWAIFSLSRLRPEQVVGGILQSASVVTINYESHIITRILRTIGEKDFVKQYGDTGEDEFVERAGTIPQRLLMMNGNLVQDQTKEGLFNAASRISSQAPDDRAAVEAAFLTVLTRRPTAEEQQHFIDRLGGSKSNVRNRRMTDLFWTLLNATEFSWNH